MAPTFAFEKGTQRYRYTSGDRKGQVLSVMKQFIGSPMIINPNRKPLVKKS
ncbi:MAG: hypothetical protein HC771_12170 [Synechococcales cyanobacterium CRU_2_2]|nr:hypothetical protein [Synechococcales cyanobacterium CRU_2_2]